MSAPASVQEVFERHLPDRLKAKPDVVAKVNAVYQFQINGPGGGSWVVDCTQAGGRVSAGQATDARCTVTCADADFLSIITGKLSPTMAFMSGKIKVQGDMGLAMKLQQILG